jgi:hypothetical protein
MQADVDPKQIIPEKLPVTFFLLFQFDLNQIPVRYYNLISYVVIILLINLSKFFGFAAFINVPERYHPYHIYNDNSEKSTKRMIR